MKCKFFFPCLSGSLEVGKLADIVAVDLIGNGDFGYPIYDPISSLVYTTHRKVSHCCNFGFIRPMEFVLAVYFIFFHVLVQPHVLEFYSIRLQICG